VSELDLVKIQEAFRNSETPNLKDDAFANEANVVLQTAVVQVDQSIL
jgi:hypothetical protein